MGIYHRRVFIDRVLSTKQRKEKTLPEVAESIVQIIELLGSPKVVNGGDKGEMDDDLVVEAKGKLTKGGVTHRFLLALGSDDPELNQCTRICTGRQIYLMRKMKAWMQKGVVIHDAVKAAQRGWSSLDKSKKVARSVETSESPRMTLKKMNLHRAIILRFF